MNSQDQSTFNPQATSAGDSQQSPQASAQALPPSETPISPDLDLENPSNGGDVSQETDAALDAQITDIEKDATILSNSTILGKNGQRLDPDKTRVESYDFRAPKNYSDLEFDYLKEAHSQWMQSLSTHLELSLKINVSCSLQSFSIQTYRHFFNTLNDPKHIILFKINQLPGIGLCFADIPLCLLMVNRLLGGQGKEIPTDRLLTDIEKALINENLLGALQTWRQLWPVYSEANSFQLIDCECNKRFVPHPQNLYTPYIIVTFDVSIEGKPEGCLQCAFPYSQIQPILAQFNKTRQTTVQIERKPTIWRETYAHIDLQVTAEWDLNNYCVNNVLSWQQGSVLKLPMSLLQQTLIKINGFKKFVGEIGLQNDHVSIQINQSSAKNNE